MLVKNAIYSNVIDSESDDNNLFFSLSQELLYITGFDGYFKKLNGAWQKTLGYSLEELLAKPFIEFVHVDDRNMTLSEFKKLLSGNNTHAFENRYLCKDGSHRWFSWNAVKVTNKQLIFASARDITESKKAEQDLRLRIEQFEYLVNAALYGIYMVDENFTIRHANAYALTAFNNIPDLNGRDFGEVMHLTWPVPKADEMIRLFRHTLETGESCVVPEMKAQRVDSNVTEYHAWEIHRIQLPNGKSGVACYFQDISQRVSAQQAILKSEERYHTLFNCMDEGYCVVEMLFDAQHTAKDFRFLEVNDAFEQQTGIKNATGKTILELIPDFNPFLIATYAKVALTGEPIRFEHEVPELNSWFDIYAFRIKTPALNIALLFTNITQRKLAQLALIENQERLEAFVNSSSDAIYSMSPNWDMMNQVEGRNFVNEAKKSNSNWLQDNIYPDDHALVLKTVKQAITTKSVFELEHRVIRTDNSVGWTYSRAVPLFNKQGDMTEWFGTASDITNRKLEQEELRQSEERFGVLFELGPVGMYTVDSMARIQEFNRNAVTMWGREPIRDDPSELYCCAHQLYSPEGDVILHTESSIAKVLKGLIPFALDVESILERIDGTKINILVNVVPLKNSNNEIIGAMKCMVDITDRKKVENVLFTNNIDLLEAKLAAEKANLAKSEFLSRMSHELRTPLNAILGFAQLLEISKPAISELQHSHVAQILHGGWHLLELINEILDLAQIESGQQNLVLEPVLVEKTIQECKELLQQQAEQFEVKLQIKATDSQHYILADKTRLKQIFINLLSNAIKYNKKGGLVNIFCSQINDVIRISVKDTGAGLDSEDLKQLFQPFSRLDKKFSAIEGTGIGLVVSKRLVELMQGTIGVQSTVGVGSEFWVEFNIINVN